MLSMPMRQGGKLANHQASMARLTLGRNNIIVNHHAARFAGIHPNSCRLP
jgi:hypothetical protein